MWFIEPIEIEGTGQEFLIALLGTNLKILGGTTVFWKYWKFTIKSLSRLLEENSILEVLNRADLSLMTNIPVKKLFQNMATQRNQDHDLPIGFLKNKIVQGTHFEVNFFPIILEAMWRGPQDFSTNTFVTRFQPKPRWHPLPKLWRLWLVVIVYLEYWYRYYKNKWRYKYKYDILKTHSLLTPPMQAMSDHDYWYLHVMYFFLQ